MPSGAEHWIQNSVMHGGLGIRVVSCRRDGTRGQGSVVSASVFGSSGTTGRTALSALRWRNPSRSKNPGIRHQKAGIPRAKPHNRHNLTDCQSATGGRVKGPPPGHRAPGPGRSAAGLKPGHTNSWDRDRLWWLNGQRCPSDLCRELAAHGSFVLAIVGTPASHGVAHGILPIRQFCLGQFDNFFLVMT